MIGLPPPPDDVAQLTAGFAIDGSYASCSWWVLIPGLEGLTFTEFRALQSLLSGVVSDFYTAITHSGTIFATCRLRSFGASPYFFEGPPSSSHGAWTGGQAMQAAVGLSWKTGESGKHHGGYTWVPGLPDLFTDDHVHLNDTGFVNALDAANGFIAGVNALTTPLPTALVLGTLHRQVAGAPLGTSVFAPFFGVVPCRHLATCRRRIPSTGSITPQ